MTSKCARFNELENISCKSAGGRERHARGREVCLGALQVLALYPANAIFTNGYLTTPGQGHAADMAMIEAAGFHVKDMTRV